jgi:pyridoxine 5-phosphate synthase
LGQSVPQRSFRTESEIPLRLGTINEAHRLKADIIEIHTGRYANAFGRDKEIALQRIIDAAKQADSLGLIVNAGHGLNYTNVTPIARIPRMNELNIGHSIIARSVFVGIEKAVREMKLQIQLAAGN